VSPSRTACGHETRIVDGEIRREESNGGDHHRLGLHHRFDLHRVAECPLGQQGRHGALHRLPLVLASQVENPDVLDICPTAVARGQDILGLPEDDGGKYALAIAIAGNGPGLADQRPDQVAIVNDGVALALLPLLVAISSPA
jgi:hypothetical protein